jgi:hypothetical protein
MEKGMWDMRSATASRARRACGAVQAVPERAEEAMGLGGGLGIGRKIDLAGFHGPRLSA